METYVDENGDLVQYDPTTGDNTVIATAGTFDPATLHPYATTPGAGAAAGSTTGATGQNTGSSTNFTTGGGAGGPNIDPRNDPTRNEYVGYQGIGNKPPWTAAGYPDFASWSSAVGQQKAADTLYRQTQIDLQNKQLAAQNGATGASTINAGIAADTAAKSLAEQKRQFDLQYANAQTPAEREKLLQEQQRQFDQSQATHKGDTLLGLGSRPDTLIKYLYALRGQQTPQGIENTTANIPGYSGVVGAQPGGNPGTAPAPAAPAPAPAAAPAAAPTAGAVDPRVAAVKQAIATPGAIDPKFVAPGGTNVTAQNPNTPPQAISGPATPTQGPTQEQTDAQNQLMKDGRKPRFFSGGVAIFKHGGPIPEHVIGVGLESGKTYEFGEAGDEFVVPHDKMKDLMGLLGKDMLDSQGTTDAAGNKSYAAGGTIGYTPTADQQSYMQQQIAATAKSNAAQPVQSTPAAPQQQAPMPAPSLAPTPSPMSAMTPVAPAAPPQPTMADKAMIGGVQVWAGGPYSGMPVSSSPTNAGDLTPYLKNPNAADPTGRVQAPQPIQQPQPQPQPVPQPIGRPNISPPNAYAGLPQIPTAGIGNTLIPPMNDVGGGFGGQPGQSGPVPMPYFGDPRVGIPGGENGSMRALPNVPLQGYGPQTGAIGNNFAGNTPTLGSQSAGFFNDPRLQQVVSRGWNSNPNTPLFPQIGIATNGGQSLIPSAQRLNSLSPAEQALYSGALQDEFGAQPEDVYSLARRFAPQSSGLRTPKFAS